MRFNKADMRAVSIVHSNMSSTKMVGARGAEAFFNFNVDGDYSISFKTGASQSFSTDFSNSNFRVLTLVARTCPGKICQCQSGSGRSGRCRSCRVR